MSEQRVTIRSITFAAGTSMSTVSNVLRGRIGYGFSCGAAGAVTVGDTQKITFEVDSEQAVETAATPTG